MRRNVAAVVYGQILITAIVATLSEDEGLSAEQLLFWVVVTMAVFWLAHVYAEGVARRLDRDRDLGAADVRELARDELPELYPAVPAVVALGLGWVGVLSTHAAADLAIALGVAALGAAGFVVGRRSHLSPLATLTAVAINAGFGLAIVALKVFIG